MDGLERLHFFNGQRLVAKDLELEQRYHIRVRRLLNRGLYSPGVVSGLEVTIVDPRHVRVSGGIALDPRGREIVLLADTTLIVPNRQPVSALPGYFLVIQYGEEQEPGVLDGCKESSGTTPPARIREAPTLAFTETWPNQQNCGSSPGHPSDCAVVLALVVLDAACQVVKIDSGVRQYAHSEAPRAVHPIALEGEKDIDSSNPKKLHFQVRGGIPEAVLLSLWGDAISSLYYTELGEHTHTLAAGGTTDVAMPNHVHNVPPFRTDPADPPTHHHLVRVFPPESDDAWPGDALAVFAPLPWNAGYRTGKGGQFIADDGFHTHTTQQIATTFPTGAPPGDHSHGLTGSTDAAGNTAPPTATPNAARGGPAYSFLDDLRVKLDGVDITGLITGKLGWAKLGDGTAVHALATNGTGALDLLQLGLAVGPGPHLLEFRVAAGGGKVLYNLYVE
jgi:hypothetical protein